MNYGDLQHLLINIKRKILKEFFSLKDVKFYCKTINNSLTFVISEENFENALHINAIYDYRNGSKEYVYIDNKFVRDLLKDAFNTIKDYAIKKSNLIELTNTNINIDKLGSVDINRLISDIWYNGYLNKLLSTPTVKLLETL